LHGQKVIASDLNLYSNILTKGKLNPPSNLNEVILTINKYNEQIEIQKNQINSINIDNWVKDFFHPNTLQETILWIDILKKNNDWFLLSCLLGILHHQRPGFLSYPSSHGAPYLRTSMYPKDEYPELYEYREVYSRLIKKVTRVLKDLPVLDFSLERYVYLQNSYDLINVNQVNTIITSPPYMKALTYARDNRLRLWFLGEENWKELDKVISPGKNQFMELMNKSFYTWSKYQKKGDLCIVIIGDIIFNKSENQKISDLLILISKKHNYSLSNILVDPIPEKRKVVKGNTRIKNENVCIFIKQQ
jgi:hypothetical protein